MAHVLEGSVRKSGDTVRITAQLVRTSDSTHLWSESYDRPLDDIFAVQDEIADAIVQALQIRMAGGELGRRRGGTQNLEAYQLYHRGIGAVNQNSKSSLGAAAEYFQAAIDLDANYGLAWTGLANTILVQTDSGYFDATAGYERARQLAQHALQLSPDSVEAHYPIQYVYRTLDWDWPAAEAEGQRALAKDPTNPDVLQISALVSATLGRWDDAEQQLLTALSRDPLHVYAVWSLGTTYYLSGRFGEAETTFRKLLEREPDFLWTRSYVGRTLLALGKPEAALAIVQEDVDEGTRLWMLPIVLQAVGRDTEADEALQAQIEHWADTSAYSVARTYAHRGDSDLAFEWLERAYRQRDAALVEIIGEPLFKNIADDPRFNVFLRKMNLPTEPVPVNSQ
jgi:tetratricopeptide (TPR) repeat protein